MSAEDRNGKVSTDEECTTQERSFDELTKGLASATMSRRGALRLLAGALFGGALASVPGVGRIAGDSGEAQAQATCAGSGESCTADNQCCQGNTCISGFCCPNLRTCAGGCCAVGASCSSRACACPAGLNACPSDIDPFGACVNLQTDRNNCGQCGKACASSQECVAGVCECTPLTCPNGCCSAKIEDPGESTCEGGNTPQACGTGGVVCLQCPDNVPNAHPTCNNGTCDFECDTGFELVNGACVAKCATNETRCGTTCVNTQTNPAHCGACNNACVAPTTSCVNGTCVAPTPTCTAAGEGCQNAEQCARNCCSGRFTCTSRPTRCTCSA